MWLSIYWGTIKWHCQYWGDKDISSDRTSTRQEKDNDDNMQSSRLLQFIIVVDTLAHNQGRSFPSHTLCEIITSICIVDLVFFSVDGLHLWLFDALLYWSVIGLEIVDNNWGVLLVYINLLRKIQYFGLFCVVVDILRNKTMTPVVVRRQGHQ